MGSAKSKRGGCLDHHRRGPSTWHRQPTRATLTNLESGLVAIGSAITSAGGLKTVTTLVTDGIEAIEHLVNGTEPATTAAAA